MAKEASRLSDKLILTSDNPRFENPDDILNDMVEGLDADDRRRMLRIADRREAIRTAAQFAQKGDVVVIAGKGHENYQEICGVKHHSTTRKWYRRFLTKKKNYNNKQCFIIYSIIYSNSTCPVHACLHI